MAKRERAEYFRERRKKFATFACEVDKEKLAELEKILEEKGVSKKEWMNGKIDEYLDDEYWRGFKC